MIQISKPSVWMSCTADLKPFHQSFSRVCFYTHISHQGDNKPLVIHRRKTSRQTVRDDDINHIPTSAKGVNKNKLSSLEAAGLMRESTVLFHKAESGRDTVQSQITTHVKFVADLWSYKCDHNNRAYKSSSTVLSYVYVYENKTTVTVLNRDIHLLYMTDSSDIF